MLLKIFNGNPCRIKLGKICIKNINYNDIIIIIKQNVI